MNFDYWFTIGNPWPDAVLDGLCRACWQGGLFLLGVWGLCTLCPWLSTTTRHWLWWLSCGKLLIALVCPLALVLPIALSFAPDGSLSGPPTPPSLGGVPPRAPAGSPHNWGVRGAQPSKGGFGSASASRSPQNWGSGEAMRTPSAVRPGESPRMSGLTSKEMDRELADRRLTARGMFRPLVLISLLWAIWLLGLTCNMGRAGSQLWRLRRLLKQARSLDNTEYAEEMRRLAAEFKMRRLPRIVATEAVKSPLVVGYFRSTIVFPAVFSETFTASEWRMALAHELAHLRRRDLWLALVPLLAQTLFFFFPPLWLACREWAVEREIACDAEALRVTGESTTRYSQLLLKVVAKDHRPGAVVYMGVAASYRALKRRLTRIQRLAAALPRRRRRLQMASVLAFGLLGIVPWRVGGSQKAGLSLETRIAQAKRERAARYQAAMFHSPAPYRLTNLGASLRVNSYATGINNTGQTVGWVSNVLQGQSLSTPTLWRNGAAQFLPNVSKSQDGFALRINDAEQVIGIKAPNTDHARGYLYRDGVFHEIGTFGGPLSSATDINAAGEVVGTADTPGKAYHAFLYAKGVLHDLGTLGYPRSSATGINDRGQIVGSVERPDRQARPFLYSGGKMRLLDILPSGNVGGSALDINNAGQILGEWHDAYGMPRAFLYSNGKTQDLGVLSPRTMSINALALNDKGQVVGYANDQSGGQRAFLYSDGKMRDLNDLIPVETGWKLTMATGINNAGQIVGSGVSPLGGTGAFRLDLK